MEKQIIHYYTIDGKCPYLEWQNNLDTSIRLRVVQRVERLKSGLYGDHKPLQKSELSELRLDFGKGYRIYYYDLENTIILLVAGSEKKNQKAVIKQANMYLDDFLSK